MATTTIHYLVNANSTAKRINAKAAAKHYVHFKHVCLAIEGRILQRDGKHTTEGNALEKHNGVLNSNERVNKAQVLALNGLKKGKIGNKITKNMVIEAIRIMSANGDLEKCETLTGYNTDKLYRKIDSTIVRLRKLNRK